MMGARPALGLDVWYATPDVFWLSHPGQTRRISLAALRSRKTLDVSQMCLTGARWQICAQVPCRLVTPPIPQSSKMPLALIVAPHLVVSVSTIFAETQVICGRARQ